MAEQSISQSRKRQKIEIKISLTVLVVSVCFGCSINPFGLGEEILQKHLFLLFFLSSRVYQYSISSCVSESVRLFPLIHRSFSSALVSYSRCGIIIDLSCEGVGLSPKPGGKCAKVNTHDSTTDCDDAFLS